MTPAAGRFRFPPTVGPRATFASIVALALAIRIANALFLLAPENPHRDPRSFAGTDMAVNYRQAIEIVERGGRPASYYKHAPLYLYFLGAVFAFDREAFGVVVAFQIAAGAFVCGLLYGIGRLAWSEGVGRWAGLLAACYGPSIFNETTFMSDALAPAAVAAVVALSVGMQHRARRLWPWAVGVGVALGAAVGLRANYALVGPALAAWLLVAPARFPRKERTIAGAIVAAISMAMVAPFCVHNTLTAGRLSFTQGDAHVPWRMSNGVESTGYFHYPPDFPDNPTHAPLSIGHLRLLARKARFLFSWFEFPDLHNAYVDGRFSPILRWNPVTFRWVGPLAILGAALSWRRRRELGAIYPVAGALTASILAYYVAARFRAAIAPLLIPFAAAAIVELFAARRRLGALAVRLGALTALLAACNAMTTERFHSVWYSDSMMLIHFRTRAVEAAGGAGGAAETRRWAERMLWIRRADGQVGGRRILAEIARAEGRIEDRLRLSAEADRIEAIVKSQPRLYQWDAGPEGVLYFPPTDRFGRIDPRDAALPPKWIGAEPIEPPRR